jgi:RepB plasmid partitioning protein/ParB-like nuclease domain
VSQAKISFEMRKVRLPLDDILPVRQIKDPTKNINRYKMILISLKEVGLVEPLVVYPKKDLPGKYLLSDGHLRYFALKELGETAADCIIATDDECFTYNARISRLPPIQEHKMIMRAVHNGVRPERVATALNMPIRIVHACMRLLDGIHEDAADLLKDKNISQKAIRLLRRVTGLRQIEIVELMVSTNNYAVGYAEALVLGTPKDQRTDPDEPKAKEGMTTEEIARMEQEMETLEHDLKAVEETYGENMLNLGLARGYIRRLLENAKVVRFLNTNHADILSEFEAIVAAESL